MENAEKTAVAEVEKTKENGYDAQIEALKGEISTLKTKLEVANTRLATNFGLSFLLMATIAVLVILISGRIDDLNAIVTTLIK